MPLREGIGRLPLRDPGVTLRAYVAVRRGRENWPPLRLISSMLD